MASQYGKWETIESLDQGGQSHIFVVKDTSGEMPGKFALKRLKNVERIDLFEREVGAVRRIDHPNILKVVDSDLKASKPYYVAELCPNGSLQKAGAARFRGNVRIAVETLLPIISALEAAHEAGVVHRDVKPSNILLRANNEPVLGDFGICHVDGECRITRTDEAMGSRDYIAPEMEAGAHGPVTGAADVYALGKVLYWMVSGGKPFARENHRGEGLYLPSLLSQQSYEHLHGRLDGLIATDPTKRSPIQLLSKLLWQTVYLIEGNFAPLNPALGLQCRWCGIGNYKIHGRVGGPGFVNWGPGLRALQCSHCGKLEVFDVQQVENPNWMSAEPHESTRGALAVAEVARIATNPSRWPTPRLSMFGFEWDIERTFLDWLRMAYEPDTNVMNSIVLGPFCMQKGCGRRVVFETFLVGGGHPVQHLENPCKNCGHRIGNNASATPLATLKRDVFQEAQRLHRNGELIRA